MLDPDGNPVKIVADVLEVIHYVIDSATSPMTSLTVTFAKVDSNNDYMQAGPLVQHVITAHELIVVLGTPGGITIEGIEESTLRTGIPGAGIEAKDLEPHMPPTAKPSWEANLIAGIRKKMEAIAKVPPAPIPPPEEPDA